MNGPSKVCALVTTQSKVYTDPIGVKTRAVASAVSAKEIWDFVVNGFQNEIIFFIFNFCPH